MTFVIVLVVELFCACTLQKVLAANYTLHAYGLGFGGPGQALYDEISTWPHFTDDRANTTTPAQPTTTTPTKATTTPKKPTTTPKKPTTTPSKGTTTTPAAAANATKAETTPAKAAATTAAAMADDPASTTKSTQQATAKK